MPTGVPTGVRGSAHGHCWIKSDNVATRMISEIVSSIGRTRVFSDESIQVTKAMQRLLSLRMKRVRSKDIEEGIWCSFKQDLEIGLSNSAGSPTS